MENKLTEELMKLPETIMNKELELVEMIETLEELKQKTSLLETVFTLEIVNEKLDDGKPKFSNETARNAELRRRLTLNKENKNLEEEIKDKQRLLNIKKIELNFLVNKQSNLRAITKIYEN